jgi:DNA polymerase
LERQLEIISPRVIVTLGRFAMQRYFPGASISRIHGQPKQMQGRWVMPIFHPAAALHQPKWRPGLEEDFQKLAELLAQAGEEKDIRPDEPTPEQLTLF